METVHIALREITTRFPCCRGRFLLGRRIERFSGYATNFPAGATSQRAAATRAPFVQLQARQSFLEDSEQSLISVRDVEPTRWW